MSPALILTVIVTYFVVLFIISWWTGRNADEKTFFSANRNAPWYLVAFGMIGASLSGITFISVPGAVGGSQFSYFQFVLGNLVGYWTIALVLLPLYYKLNLTSIYGYLEQRFGVAGYKSGAVMFLVSRVIGASLRLYIVATVLDLTLFGRMGIPFWLTVVISITLIYIYTVKGGIKTVVWTDTLQTTFLIVGAILAVYFLTKQLGWGFEESVAMIRKSKYSETFFWDWSKGSHFFKQFISGALIAIVMTGLDQDMMQKNLTVKTLKDAQKNMFWFSSVFVIANILFLSLGALLYLYGHKMGILQEVYEGDCKIMLLENGEWVCHLTDHLFPIIAVDHLTTFAGILIILGVIAAAYSSADSALTALTTSFCVDILGFEKRDDAENKNRIRRLVHLGFAAAIFVTIMIFQSISNDAVVWEIFRAAGYTYGPLLGLYAFGIYTGIRVNDKAIPWICILSPVLSYTIAKLSPIYLGYSFGLELLVLNGFLTFVGLFLVREGGNEE